MEFYQNFLFILVKELWDFLKGLRRLSTSSNVTFGTCWDYCFCTNSGNMFLDYHYLGLEYLSALWSVFGWEKFHCTSCLVLQVTVYCKYSCVSGSTLPVCCLLFRPAGWSLCWRLLPQTAVLFCSVVCSAFTDARRSFSWKENGYLTDLSETGLS